MSKFRIFQNGPLWETYISCPYFGIDESLHLSEESARAHINAMKKRYLHEALRRYLEHKEQIIGNSPFYYSTSAKLRSLGLCKEIFTGLQGKTTREICGWILYMKDHLERVLPHSKKNFFLSERKKLQEIIAFAMHETGWYLKNEQLKIEIAY